MENKGIMIDIVARIIKRLLINNLDESYKGLETKSRSSFTMKTTRNGIWQSHCMIENVDVHSTKRCICLHLLFMEV